MTNSDIFYLAGLAVALVIGIALGIDFKSSQITKHCSENNVAVIHDKFYSCAPLIRSLQQKAPLT